MRTQETLQFFHIPENQLPAFAPLSRPMVDHLVKLECIPYRRAVLSSWPEPQKIWSSVLERVVHARDIVYEYMHPFVFSDVLHNETECTFPDDAWILEMLAVYAPDGTKNSKKAVEDWQARNVLRRHHPRGRWRRASVAALLIMRIVNTTHQRGWLPSEIAEDEPRWWCYGKVAPGAPVRAFPLQGADVGPPLLLWTYWLGGAWSRKRHLYDDVVMSWSRPFMSAEEVAVWHVQFAEEIREMDSHSVAISSAELQNTQRSTLLASQAAQRVVYAGIERIVQEVRVAMLEEAAHLILEEQVRNISKEK